MTTAPYRRKVIYRITYPNGKIYIGKDSTGSLTYFGSPCCALVARDFTDEQSRSFTITKDILFSFDDISEKELIRLENEQIRLYRSYDPAIGYNRNIRRCATDA